MAEQSWFDAGSTKSESPSFFAPSGAAPPPLPRGGSGYELRPLTTGEVLDRTFFLFRNHFWLFVGLSAIAAAISTVTSLLQLLYLHFAKAPTTVEAFSAGKVIFSFVATLLYLVVYSVTQAATVSAVTAIYLGDATSMGQALKAVVGRWYRYFVIAMWQAWSGIWLVVVLAVPAGVATVILQRKTGGAGGSGLGLMAGLGLLLFVGIFGGTIYGVIAYIRNSLAVAAEVMEGLTVRRAMRRSKELAAGTKGRIFLLFLFLTALYVVAIAVESPLTFLIIKQKGLGVGLLQAMLVFVNFVVASVVAPVGAIGLCLFYIDQRVRKEGFDIDFLIERSGPVPTFAPADLLATGGDVTYPVQLP